MMHPVQSQWIVAWSVAVFSAVIFLPFGWAVRGHFVQKGPIPAGMKILSGVNLLFYASMLLNLGGRDRPPSWIGMTTAFVLMAAAGILFWWSIATTRTRRLHLAHSGRSSDHVQAAGPYRWIRHPFYTSYILFWLGTGALAGRWQWIPALLISGWYVVLARKEEDQFARSTLAGDYEAYRRRTGMVLPRARGLFQRGQC